MNAAQFRLRLLVGFFVATAIVLLSVSVLEALTNMELVRREINKLCTPIVTSGGSQVGVVISADPLSTLRVGGTVASAVLSKANVTIFLVGPDEDRDSIAEAWGSLEDIGGSLVQVDGATSVEDLELGHFETIITESPRSTSSMVAWELGLASPYIDEIGQAVLFKLQRLPSLTTGEHTAPNVYAVSLESSRSRCRYTEISGRTLEWKEKLMTHAGIDAVRVNLNAVGKAVQAAGDPEVVWEAFDAVLEDSHLGG